MESAGILGREGTRGDWRLRRGGGLQWGHIHCVLYIQCVLHLYVNIKAYLSIRLEQQKCHSTPTMTLRKGVVMKYILSTDFLSARSVTESGSILY